MRDGRSRQKRFVSECQSRSAVRGFCATSGELAFSAGRRTSLCAPALVPCVSVQPRYARHLEITSPRGRRRRGASRVPVHERLEPVRSPAQHGRLAPAELHPLHIEQGCGSRPNLPAERLRQQRVRRRRRSVDSILIWTKSRCKRVRGAKLAKIR